MNRIAIAFETELDTDRLHELLCLAIHECDFDACEALSDAVVDVAHPDQHERHEWPIFAVTVWANGGWNHVRVQSPDATRAEATGREWFASAKAPVLAVVDSDQETDAETYATVA